MNGSEQRDVQPTNEIQVKILKDLERYLLRAKFKRALQTFETKLEALTPGPDPDEPMCRMRLRAMAVEVLDYFGRYDQARALITAAGAQCLDFLQDLEGGVRPAPRNDEDRRVLKQRVWLVLHYGMSLYREGRYEDAKRKFEICRKVIDAHLTTQSYKSHGTLARAYYSLGLVHRELFAYTSAKYNFTKSIECAWDSAQAHSPIQAARRQFSDLVVCKCLALGLSYVYFNEGRADLAKPILLAARNMLARSSETLIKSYIDVIYACVLRSAHGDDEKQLSDALSLLHEAHNVFTDHHHDGYKVRAAYHLAITLIQKAITQPNSRGESLRAARQYVDEVALYARARNDISFACNALIMGSRIDRWEGKPFSAQEKAGEALTIGHERIVIRVDALIARGEARVDLGYISDAINDFDAALRSGFDNLKVRAVCHLHLANAFLQQNDIRRSHQHLDHWKELKPVLQNAFARHLELKVTTAWKSTTKDFIVRWETIGHEPAQLETKLHGFLTAWAKANSKSDEQAAALLKISKQTFYNWRAAAEKLEDSEKKAQN